MTVAGYHIHNRTILERPLSLGEDRELQVRREILVTLFAQVPNATIGNSVGSLLLCAALWPIQDHLQLGIWLLLVNIACVLRHGVYLLFTRRAIAADALVIGRWERALQCAVVLQVVAWGLSVLMAWPQPLEYRALVLSTLVGVMAVGAVLMSIHRSMVVSYLLPIYLAVVLRLVVDGLYFELWLAALISFYTVLLYIASGKQVSRFREAILLRLEMENLSRVDPLTQLVNRRAFDEFLNSFWHQAQRAHTPLALLYLDADYFKLYNDHYGHPSGDTVLKQLARTILLSAGRSVDCVARIGGEEFALILPYTDAHGAEQVAEKILQDVRELGIPHAKSPRAIVTISIGVAVFSPSPADVATKLIEAADHALYRAKSAGRDRMITAQRV